MKVRKDEKDIGLDLDLNDPELKRRIARKLKPHLAVQDEKGHSSMFKVRVFPLVMNRIEQIYNRKTRAYRTVSDVMRSVVEIGVEVLEYENSYEGMSKRRRQAIESLDNIRDMVLDEETIQYEARLIERIKQIHLGEKETEVINFVQEMSKRARE